MAFFLIFITSCSTADRLIVVSERVVGAFDKVSSQGFWSFRLDNQHFFISWQWTASSGSGLKFLARTPVGAGTSRPVLANVFFLQY